MVPCCDALSLMAFLPILLLVSFAPLVGDVGYGFSMRSFSCFAIWPRASAFNAAALLVSLVHPVAAG